MRGFASGPSRSGWARQDRGGHGPLALPPLQLTAETLSRQGTTARWGRGVPTTSASCRGFASTSGPGWFPQFGWTPEIQPDPIPQTNELMELGSQLGQTRSPILPPKGDDMEQTAPEREGEQTVRDDTQH